MMTNLANGHDRFEGDLMGGTSTLCVLVVLAVLTQTLGAWGVPSSQAMDGNGAVAARSSSTRASLPATGTYRGMATGDIDHDGNMDLVAAGDNGVAAWGGDGKGSWTAKTGPTNTGKYNDVALSDVNHDGDLDVIAAGDNGVQLWTGNGAWAWAVGTSPIGSGRFLTVEVVDMNIDGNPDVITGAPGGIRVRLGNGIGGWTVGTSPTTTDTYYGLVIGDLNLDGKLDIAAAGNDSTANNATLKTFMGDGTGSWPSSVTVIPGVKGPLFSVGMADINHDGRPDLCAAGVNSLYCWKGNGANGWTQGTSPTWAHDNKALLLSDLNHDGKADIVIGDENGTRVWLGDGGVSWPSTPAIPFHNVTVLGLSQADLNHDAKQDIIAATKGKGLCVWMSDIPDVKITGWTLASTNLQSTGKWADIDFGDVNNDGNPDIVSTSYGGTVPLKQGIIVYLGDGTGTWANSSTGLPGPGTNGYSGVRLTDLNHDGKLDMVASADAGGAGAVGSRVWKGNGDGTWTFDNTIDTRSGTGLEIGDFNNDGKTDMATGFWGNGWGPMVFLGDGDLTFQTDSGPTSAINPDDTTIGDVDNDGKQDFAMSTMNNAGIQLWTGDGTGSSTSWTREDAGLPTTAVYLGLAMADVDNDGDLDLAGTSYAGAAGLHVYLGDGGAGGTVDWTQASKGLPTTNQFSGVELADLDLNGKVDLVAGNVSNGGVDLFKGNGGVGGTVNWTEIGKAPLPSTGNVWGVRFGDINNDGVLDIAATPDGSGVRVWRTDVAPVTYFDHVDITPTSGSLNTTESRAYSAQAYDAANKPVAGLKYVWEFEGPNGIISLNTTDGPNVKLSGLSDGKGKLRVTVTQGLFAKGKTFDVTVVTPVPPKDVTISPQYSVVPGAIWTKWTNMTGKQENATITIGLKALGRNITVKDKLKVNFTLAQGIEPVNGTFLPAPNATVRNANGTTVLRWNVSSIQNSTTSKLKFDMVSRNAGASVPVNVPPMSDIRFLNLSGPQVLRPSLLSVTVLAVKTEVPGAPRNLTATAGDGYVQLSWVPPILNGNSTVTGYKVYRGIVAGSEALLKQVGNVTNLNDTNVTNNVKYFYKVSAQNAVGEGPPSLTVNATPRPPAGPPGAPRNLMAVAGNNYVQLTWDPPASDGGAAIIGYRLFRGTVKGAGGLLLEVTGTSHNDTTATNNITYYYSVSARNYGYEGPRTPEVNATPTVPKRVPSAPRDLKALEGDGNVTLSWKPPLDDGGSPVTGYVLIRGLIPGRGQVLKTLGTNLSYKDTGLTNGVTYYYSLAAVNLIGTGPASPEAAATPWSLPQGPRSIKAQGGSEVAEVHLTWDPPVSDGGYNIIGYKIYRSSTGPNGPYELLGQSNSTNYLDSHVKAQKTYYYKVSAVTSKGEGSMTGPVEAKVKGTGNTISAWTLIFIIGIVAIMVAVVVAVILIVKRRKGRAQGLQANGPVHGPQQVDLIGGMGQGAPPTPPPPAGPPAMGGGEASGQPPTSVEVQTQGPQDKPGL
jgi:fibronectin type 3 domain-containing protein